MSFGEIGFFVIILLFVLFTLGLEIGFAMALAGFITGGLWVALSAWLRHRRGINETIASLLLSYIGIALFNFLVEGVLRDPASLNKPSTRPIGDLYAIGALPGLEVHWGLLWGLVACIFAWLLMRYTVFGFAVGVVGGNPRAALMAGLPVGGLLAAACFLGGGAAGLAGMLEVAAVHGSANASLLAGYGIAGILVSFAARHHPLGIIACSILVGGIGASGSLLQRRLDLPDAATLVLQGTLFLALLAFALPDTDQDLDRDDEDNDEFSPIGLDVDSQGKIYVADAKGRRALVFDGEGNIELEIDPKTKTVVASSDELLDLWPDRVGEDPGVKAIVARHAEAVGKIFETVVATAPAFMGREPDRENALGDWMTDCYRGTFGVDAALQNGGGIRAEIQAGPVTLRDIFNVMPFDNALVTLTMKGSDLRAVFDHGVGMGKIAQVSGAKIEYFPDQPPAIDDQAA